MIVIKNATVRKILKVLLPFVIIPLVILCGVFVFKEKSYAFVSLTVTVLAVLLFMTGIEKRQIGSRRLIIVAVLTTLSVVGRFIPFFKPVTAITIIAAVHLGGESGFLVGSLSAVISNFYFGQGPWTPFQMFAWGMTGLIAGFLASPLKKSRLLIILYGIVSGILYSLIMDIWTVLWYSSQLSAELYLASVSTAIPHIILYCISNALFLYFIEPPFGRKLERIKLKYNV